MFGMGLIHQCLIHGLGAIASCSTRPGGSACSLLVAELRTALFYILPFKYSFALLEYEYINTLMKMLLSILPVML